MRFAGSRIEGFLGDKPDYGALASGASKLRSKERQAVTDIMGKTAAAGVSAAGQVKASEITGSAQQAMASAQSQASIMGTIGQVGGAFIGAGIKQGAFDGLLKPNPTPKIDLDKFSGAWTTPVTFGGYTPSEVFTKDLGISVSDYF